MRKCLLPGLILCLCALCACGTAGETAASEQSAGQAQVLLQTDYAEILTQDGQYIYTVCGSSGEVIEHGDSTRPPEITMDGQLLTFSLQTGTGASTRWGFFYDFANGVKSEPFTYIYDVQGSLVAYGDGQSVVVQDIFDPAAYRQTFSDFSPPLADIAEPVLSAAFTEDGAGLKVLYASGEDLHEETQRFSLCTVCISRPADFENPKSIFCTNDLQRDETPDPSRYESALYFDGNQDGLISRFSSLGGYPCGSQK